MGAKKNAEHAVKKSRLTMSNGTAMSVPPQLLGPGLGGFLSQPLPVLARLDLKMVCDAVVKQAEVLNEAKIELMKKHGAVEKEGSLSIKFDSDNYAAYAEEFKLLCDRTFELPLTSKVSLPASLVYLGQRQDLVMDGVAAAILDGVIEVVR